MPVRLYARSVGIGALMESAAVVVTACTFLLVRW